MGFAAEMKTIVVATDLEGHSEAALDYARKLAGAYGARIVLAHGIDPLEYADVEAVPRTVLRRMPEQARAVLDEMAAELMRQGIHSHSEVRQGAVVQMLLDVARQYSAGLVVVGTKGREGAGPVAVATIAEQMARRAPCPVLAVAADWNAGEFRPVPGGPVLLAVERNESMPAAVAAALSLAETFHRALVVVHARTAAEASAFLNPCATTARQFGIPEQGPVAVRCIVKDGTPIDVLNDAITQYAPSILVAGCKQKSDSGRVHGTAFSLLATSRVPVLCVPAEAVREPEETGAHLPAEIY